MRVCKSLIAAVAVVGLGAAAQGAVLINESFTYANGNLVGNDPAIGGAWAAHSGAGSVPVQVSGGAAVLAQGPLTREDVNSTFEGGFVAGAGNTLYSAFDLTIADPGAPITSVNFAHFMQGTSVFAGRVWVTTPTASGYRIAVSGDNALDSDGEVYSGDLAFGQTYRIVTSYDYDSGDSTLWIDPTSPTSPSQTTTDGTFQDEVVAYAFRQAGGNTVQTIDNLLVGTTLADVGVVPEPAGLAVLALGAVGMMARRRR